jgi:hypothetical protein
LNGEEKSVFVIHRLVKEWRTQKRTYVFSLDFVFYLLLVDSAVGGTKYCSRGGKSDVIELHLKVASTIRGCEAYGVILLSSMGSVCPEPYELKILCLLRVDPLANISIWRTRRKHISSEKSTLLRPAHCPTYFNSPIPRQLATSYPYVCVSVSLGCTAVS